MNIEVVKQILASDIINWFFAAVGGALAYFLLHRMQSNRERHSMIKVIEDSISILMDQKQAMSRQGYNENDFEIVTFRTILHNFSRWLEFDSSNVRVLEGQRYILIRDDEKYCELMSTGLIHESLIWFRRVNKLYKDRIIKDEDLADLWRQILPFIKSGKLEFYRSYLGEDDTYPILAVCLHCIYACKKYNRITAIKGLSEVFETRVEYEKYITELKTMNIRKKRVLKKM